MLETSFTLLLLRLIGIHALAAASPGPDVLLVLRHSLRSGWVAGLATTGGILGGVAVWIILGLSLRHSLQLIPGHLLLGLQALGGTYLAWIGFQGLRAPSIPESSTASAPIATPVHTCFGQGLLTNLTNAKALLYFVALFTQGLPPDLPLGTQAAIGVTLLGTQAAIFAALAGLAASAGRLQSLLPTLRWLDRLGCITLGLLGVWLFVGACFGPTWPSPETGIVGLFHGTA